MKIAKSKLAQIIKEELSNTVSEAEQWKMGRSMKADDLAADPLYAAENQGMADAQDDFMRSKRGEGVSPDLPSFGSQEEEDAYGKAWGKEWHRLMDNAVKIRIEMERKLNYAPEPETDADREAAEAELDFEATYSEGMMDAIKNKLSPKRPTATAPRKRSENGNEAMRLQGVSDAEDAKHISGDYRESPSSDDEDYMAGWNSVMQEGKNKMKITKSKLAQIIQEELSAVKAEGYKAYKRDDMSPHAKDMAKNRKKGYSPQAANTAIPGHEESYKAYWDSLNKKPKRGKKDLGEAEGRYEFELDPKVQQSVLQALANSGTGALDFPLPLTPEQEKYYSHLDDGDRQSMLRDVVEELVELGKIKVADGLYYAVQRLEEDWGDLEENEIYALEALMSLGGEQPASDIAAIASDKYENAIGTEELEDFGDYIQTALESLQAKGKVRLTQGGPGSGVEEIYALA